MKSEPIGPDKELINRAFRIKPLLSDREGRLHFIEPREIYDRIWDMDGVQSAGDADAHVKKLAEVGVLLPATLWGGQAPGPTIAQVLPQVPRKYLEQAVAFEVRMTGGSEGENGYVRGVMTLYSGTLPPEVQAQPVVAWKKVYKEPFPVRQKPKKDFNPKAATTLKKDVTVMKGLSLKKPAAPKPKPDADFDI